MEINITGGSLMDYDKCFENRSSTELEKDKQTLERYGCDNKAQKVEEEIRYRENLTSISISKGLSSKLYKYGKGLGIRTFDKVIRNLLSTAITGEDLDNMAKDRGEE